MNDLTPNTAPAWKTKPLGELFDVVGGGTPAKKKASYYGGHIPWATIRDMHSATLSRTEHTLTDEGLRASSARLIPAGEVIMASRVGLGKACLLEQDTAINQDIRALLPRKPGAIDRRFCLYWLQTMSETIVGAGSGATVQGVKLPFIKSLPFPDISLEEQKQVVAVLDQALAALDRARANAEINLADAEALPQAAIDKVFLSDSPTWRKSTLGEVCKFVGGSQPPKSVFQYSAGEGLVRLIQIRDYKSDEKAVFIPKELARRFCNADDVMIGRYGPPLFQILRGLEGAYNVALMKAIPDETEISKDFLFNFLKNGRILQYIIAASSRAAGQAGISKTTIEPYPIAYPGLEEQRAIVRRLELIWGESEKIIRSCRRKLGHLDELRYSVLHKAFSGKLT